MADARPLLLFFSHAHSGPARRMEGVVAHVARKERARLRVATVDVERRPDLADRVAVREVPALVLVGGGRAVARLEGRSSVPRIERMLAPFLAGDGATTREAVRS